MSIFVLVDDSDPSIEYSPQSTSQEEAVNGWLVGQQGMPSAICTFYSMNLPCQPRQFNRVLGNDDEYCERDIDTDFQFYGYVP